MIPFLDASLIPVASAAVLGGGLGWMARGPRLARLQARLPALEADTARLTALLDRDPLTGAYSRHYFMTRMTEEIARAHRTALHLAIADIDHFKSLNDSYGHDAGDAFLRRVAERLAALVGGRGVVARIGGDEFWIALRGQDDAAARALVETIRAEIAAMEIESGPWRAKRSLSIGLTRAGRRQGLADAMHEADHALYVAKAAGRNRVIEVDATMRARRNAGKDRDRHDDRRSWGRVDDLGDRAARPGGRRRCAGLAGLG